MWRRLRPGELDHEALWLGVSLATLAVAWVWVRLALPVPACPFHGLTGWACPGCGATRCVRHLFRGEICAAILVNPLMFATLGVIALFDLFAAIVLTLRLRRWRPARVPAWFRAGCAALVAGNWVWLLRSGV